MSALPPPPPPPPVPQPSSSCQGGPPPPPLLPPTSSRPPPPPPPQRQPPLANNLLEGSSNNPTKLSPAALHGVTNTTTVKLPPEQALGEAAARAARFDPLLAQGPWFVYCPHVPPARLQEGPQCGLVALSLAAATRGLCSTPGEIQDLAIKKGFSARGEMFSAADMSELSREVLGGGELLSISSLLDNDWLVKIFTEGKQLLIPYDCAANHSPCLEGGRKAHWALVVGFAWQPVGFNFGGTPLDLAPGWQKTSEAHDPSKISGKVMLVARQSKSLVLGLWERGDLVESCINLKTFHPKKGEEDMKYVLPQGGVEAGLAGKMVLLPAVK